MRGKRILKAFCSFCVAIAIIVSMVLSTYTAVARSDSKFGFGIQYDAKARAIAKAYYTALVWCYDKTDNENDLSIWHALNGKWGGDSDDGDTASGTGDDLSDDFLNVAVRGLDDDDQDCEAGNLISEAINYFLSITTMEKWKDKKSWDKWTLADKQLLFCGTGKSGFFQAVYDRSWVVGDLYWRDCYAYTEIVNSRSSNEGETGDYAFENTGQGGGNINSGRDYLKNYINSQFFGDTSFKVGSGYSDDEMFYVYSYLTSSWCAGGKSSSLVNPNLSNYMATIDFVLGDDGTVNTQQLWWHIEHDRKNADWMYLKGDGWADTTSADCDEELNTKINDKNSKYYQAAKNTLVNYKKEDCLKNYEKFYNEQSAYYFSRSSEERASDVGVKYDEWFKSLTRVKARTQEESAAWNDAKKEFLIEQDENPIFQCKVEEYIRGLMDKNPDANSPPYNGYSPSGLPSDGVQPGGNVTVDPTCANSGGAESLGWIVCPLLSVLSNAATDFYVDALEPQLQIDTTLLFSSGKPNEATKQGWDTFQNIANVVFVILFMVVIFSQLTGVGIDNYGIKKILPKLIVTALLINLSYYICVICVDLSNILGNGFRALFDGLQVSVPQNVVDASTSSSGVGTTLVSAGILVVLVGSTFVALWRNPAIILSLLVGALGVFIAFVFLFVLLAGREAAILVLTVISPLAFVCFILPNTKKLFDKWLKFGEQLLLVYPICGLLVGGGNYISRLLISSGISENGWPQALTAMLVGVVPIFFIPTVLKGAFAAMGSIGARISGFGDRARGGATRWLRNRDGFKDAQERGLERRTRIRAGLDKNGNDKKVGAFGRFMRGGKRNMARSRAQYLKNQDVRNREDSLMNVGYDAARVGQTKRAEAEEMANYMTLINNETQNGENEEALFGMYDKYMSEDNKAGAVAVARIAGRRKDTAARFLSRCITGSGLEAEKEVDEFRQRAANNSAHSKVFESVAKEISTGENSRMYKESSPLGFEFAAQYNRTGSNIDYTDWSSSSSNIERAVDNYVTNSQELVGAKNGSLKEIAEKMEDGTLDEAHVTRLRNLARETIQNRSATGVWDSTKAENIYRIAGMEMPTGIIGDERVSGAPVPPAPHSDAASEGEIFSTRGGNGNTTLIDTTSGPIMRSGGTTTGSGIILDPTGEQAQQAMREVDAQQRARGNRNWPGNGGI